MAKIFSAPKEIKIPTISIHKYEGETYRDKLDNYRKAEEKYLQDLKDYLIGRGLKGENLGEIIQFQVADGYALYMVASMKPLQLIHIELGDGWSFQYANLLTKKEVQENIDQQKALKKIFKN